jgi:hypothetical protein
MGSFLHYTSMHYTSWDTTIIPCMWIPHLPWQARSRVKFSSCHANYMNHGGLLVFFAQYWLNKDVYDLVFVSKTKISL